MPTTPWSSTGSLVSDRISSRPSSQQQQNKGKGKGKTPTPGLPKSKAVRVLEARLEGARASDGRIKDANGGCFCQARNHTLSSYVPMCRRCGLILCTLNPPYYACPHCASALLGERDREALVVRLQGELAEQLAREEAERQRVIEEARAAEGAFPSLPGSQTERTSRTPPVPATRTVLSLNSETKRVTVSSYSTPPVTRSRPVSRGENREEDGRVSRPSDEVSFVRDPPDPRRPWRSGRDEDVRYVPLAKKTTMDTDERGRRKKGGKRGTTSTGPHE